MVPVGDTWTSFISKLCYNHNQSIHLSISAASFTAWSICLTLFAALEIFVNFSVLNKSPVYFPKFLCKYQGMFIHRLYIGDVQSVPRWVTSSECVP